MGTRYKFTNKDWKEKAINRSRELTRTKQELKRQKARANKWRRNYYGLKKENTPTQVKGHKYPLELIWMAVLMHINFNVSLRGVSQSMVKLGELYGLTTKYISHMTIRNWCLKFGLYCLLSPINSGKYVLIIDESVEIGRERLLLLLVIPVEYYSPIVALRMEDVKVLDLGVQQSWTATQVAQKIKQKTEMHGLEISYGISDKCSKLRRAMRECGLKWIGDCTHEMANVSKAIFKKDVLANAFIIKMNLLRRKWILSKHTLLVPPELRTKNRFHQMFIIHKWAEQILSEWGSICESAKEELFFVQEGKPLIKVMRQCYDLIEVFSSIFKAKGIHNNSLEQWKETVKEYKEQQPLSEQAAFFIKKMDEYLNRQKANIPENIQILCCSDIIESTFGKYKNKGVKIITDDVLKIAAYSKKSSLGEVARAMQEIKIKDTLEWKQNNTTISKLALLKQKRKTAA